MPRRLMAAFLCLFPVAGAAELLAPGEAVRALPFTLRDGKPMIAATIAGQDGVVMFDTGTPHVLMLNRDALGLPAGQEVARGHAASGQAVVVKAHPAPTAILADRQMDLPEPVLSGDFGFTRAGLGADFLGFLGTPAVAATPFTLDLARGRLTLLAAGTAPPAPEDIVADITFFFAQGEQPLWAGRLGDLPILIDIDTGDGGTIYLTDATRAALVQAGRLAGTGPEVILTGLGFGGASFGPVPVRVVSAGGPQDMRRTGQPDLLRLGAGFLSAQPSLWDFPARRLVFLRPGAAILAR